MSQMNTAEPNALKTVLVIDDDPLVRTAVRTHLREHGYAVLEAASGEAGVELGRTRLPDLILSDVCMAPGDGFEVLRRLSETPATSGIPFILMTGDPEIRSSRRPMEAGADDFLSKPFTERELVSAVEARLRRREAQGREKRALNERLVAIVEASADLVLLVEGADLRVTYSNSAANTTLGLGHESSPDLESLEQWVTPATLDILRGEALPLATQEGRWVGTATFRTPAGQEVATRLQVHAHGVRQNRTACYSLVAHDLTEEHRAAREAVEARLILQQILDTIPQRVFWKDRQSVYLGCNQSFARDGGFGRADDVVGRTDFEASWAAIAPAYRADDAAVMDHDQPRLSYEEATTLADGRHRWIRTSKVPCHDAAGRVVGVLGTYEDITDRKAVEQQVRDALVYNETLLRASPIGIITYRATGETVSANPAAARIIGANVDQLFEQNFLRLESWRASGLLAAAQESLATGREQELDLHHTTSFGRRTRLAVRLVPFEHEGQRHLLVLFNDVTAEKEAVETLRKLSRAVEQSPASVVITDATGAIEYVNPKFVEVTGYRVDEVLGKNPRVLRSGETPHESYRALWQAIAAGQEWRGEFHNRRKTGELYWEAAVISPIKDDAGRITHFLAVKEDITERKRAERERAQMELQLRHAQKLESIGQLAAGIAHEINTPTQYIGDNIGFLQDAFADLEGLLAGYDRLLQSARLGPVPAGQIQEMADAAARVDVPYLSGEIPRAIQQALEGVGRVSKIVRAMKEFSHPGAEEKTAIDLNRAIESTLTISRNEWKYVAEMVTNFDPLLPPVPCLPGEFNQVILNLVVNAAHAIADVVGDGSRGKGTITVTTRHLGGQVEVRVRDTGSGIPEKVRSRIFEPFFTTKGVGKGTGQGLAIARSVIVDKHGGSIEFETAPGRGTEFILRLPLPAAPPPIERPS